jgi:hypothetical protein
MFDAPADKLTPESVMKDQPSLLRNEKIWSPAPSGVNPFAYLMNRSASVGSVPMSGLTKALLIVFFIIHLIIAIFCLVILVLPCFRGSRRSHWLFRRLYIRDQSSVANGLSTWLVSSAFGSIQFLMAWFFFGPSFQSPFVLAQWWDRDDRIPVDGLSGHCRIHLGAVLDHAFSQVCTSCPSGAYVSIGVIKYFVVISG